jgi:linoleoyl-CoA desaturase
MSKLSFGHSSAFYTEVKQSVDHYFQHKGLQQTGDYRLYLKSILLLLFAVGSYLSLVNGWVTGWWAVGLSALLGFNLASIGFCIMHDANHGSYSRMPMVNQLMSIIGSNGLGANAFFWKQKHNVIHHTYTNVDGMDDDIAKSPIIRQCITQRWVPAHRWQHIYLPFVYCLTSVFWIFFMDFNKYFTRRINGTKAWKMQWNNHLAFWLTKIYYLAVFIAIPVLLVGWQSWLIGFLLMNFSMGLTLSLVFQLAHVVEGAEFELVESDQHKHLSMGWAEHQLHTTFNFAMNNRVLSWFVGGLNFQVEHHLFPRVSHVHYPAISNIVAAACRKHQLPYRSFVSFRQALLSHFRWMKWLGMKPA